MHPFRTLPAARRVALKTFMLDPRHWYDDPDEPDCGKCVVLFDSGAKADLIADPSHWRTDLDALGALVRAEQGGAGRSRARRAEQGAPVDALINTVNAVVTLLYNSLPDYYTPLPASLAASLPPDAPAAVHPMPAEFQAVGCTWFKDVPASEWSASTRQTFQDAAKLIKSGQLSDPAQGHYAAGGGKDAGYTGIENAEADGEADSLTYLMAKTLLLGKDFHAGLDELYGSTAGATVQHGPGKGRERAESKAEHDYGKAVHEIKDWNRATVKVTSHAMLATCLAQLQARWPAAQPPKDRREKLQRDVLQVRTYYYYYYPRLLLLHAHSLTHPYMPCIYVPLPVWVHSNQKRRAHHLFLIQKRRAS